MIQGEKGSLKKPKACFVVSRFLELDLCCSGEICLVLYLYRG